MLLKINKYKMFKTSSVSELKLLNFLAKYIKIVFCKYFSNILLKQKVGNKNIILFLNKQTYILLNLKNSLK